MIRLAGQFLAVIAVLVASSRSETADSPPAPANSERSHEPIKALPPVSGLDAGKVALGRALFHEPRLSRDNTISCASCHDLGQGGTDGRRHALGIQQTEGAVNVPTVFNAALNFKQFWDGRAATLEDQIDGPIQDPAEMGSTWGAVVEKLRAAPEYRAAFTRLYRGQIEPRTIKDAIAQFERSLTTPNARFDRYLRGDDRALTTEELSGYAKFKSYGCVSCHQGVNAGGNMFQRLGTMGDYFGERGGVTKADYGRFNVTGREQDRFVFKVPGLRNVALTAPYFHDGSVARLEDAVALMGRFQLGRDLSVQDIEELVKFLGTLTGEFGGQPQ